MRYNSYLPHNICSLQKKLNRFQWPYQDSKRYEEYPIESNLNGCSLSRWSQILRGMDDLKV